MHSLSRDARNLIKNATSVIVIDSFSKSSDQVIKKDYFVLKEFIAANKFVDHSTKTETF